jgi:hypothetical protein
MKHAAQIVALCSLVLVVWTPEPALTFGVEFSYGKTMNKYDGVIDTGDDMLASPEQSRTAQRVSFGLFFDF